MAQWSLWWGRCLVLISGKPKVTCSRAGVGWGLEPGPQLGTILAEHSCKQSLHHMAYLMLEASHPVFSIPLCAGEKQSGEHQEEENTWAQRVKEQKQKEERRRNELIEALERERRELEKLDQERVSDTL